MEYSTTCAALLMVLFLLNTEFFTSTCYKLVRTSNFFDSDFIIVDIEINIDIMLALTFQLSPPHFFGFFFPLPIPLPIPFIFSRKVLVLYSLLLCSTCACLFTT